MQQSLTGRDFGTEVRLKALGFSTVICDCSKGYDAENGELCINSTVVYGVLVDTNCR